MKALLLALALAQTQPALSKAVQPTTKIIFGEEAPIAGTLKGPFGSEVDVIQAPKFASVVRVRSSFRREVLQSSSDLK